MPPPLRSELYIKLEAPDADYAELAAFLKTHIDIADDKAFARLVKKQGEHLDDLAEVVATNHRIADVVGVEITNVTALASLKSLGISAEQVASYAT